MEAAPPAPLTLSIGVAPPQDDVPAALRAADAALYAAKAAGRNCLQAAG